MKGQGIKVAHPLILLGNSQVGGVGDPTFPSDLSGCRGGWASGRVLAPLPDGGLAKGPGIHQR